MSSYGVEPLADFSYFLKYPYENEIIWSQRGGGGEGSS